MMTEFTKKFFKQVLNYGFDQNIGFELSERLDLYTPHPPRILKQNGFEMA